MKPQRETRKTVTIVFCDVAGSTGIAETVDPEALRAAMSRYFDEMRSVIERHGGVVEKFIGDAVMAVFGTPVMQEDDALRAARAACEMAERVERLSAELTARWGIELKVKIGVNTGEVVAGDVRHGGQGFVAGDSVNVAARLQQAAQAGEILVGDETGRLIEGSARLETAGPLELKGKAEPVRACRLLGMESTAATRIAADAPLVGRDAELRHLEQGFEDSVTGRCRLVTVLGPAGIGKSRLVAELVSRLADRARVLEGRCLSYGEAITFWPLGEIVREAGSVGEQDPPDVAREKIAALLVSDETERSIIVDRIAGALGMPSEPTGSLDDTFWAFRRLFESLARERPLVVILDDLHWAEEGLLDLIEHAVASSSHPGLLLVCVGRPDLLQRRPHWEARGDGVRILRLEPLDGRACARVAAGALEAWGKPARLDADVLDDITERADGNPLFVRELLRELIEDGCLRLEEDVWRYAGAGVNERVPSSLEALLGARLDRLPVTQRTVLEAAAVVGYEFLPAAVEELCGAEPQVRDHLAALTDKGLVRFAGQRLGGDEQLRFEHVLVREVTYKQLLKGRRADLHEHVASWLEARAGERVTEYGELIGYHFEQAHRYRIELGPTDDRALSLARRASSRLGTAGRFALARGDATAAANLLARAIALLPENSPERSELSLKLGIAHAEAGRFTRALALVGEQIERERRGHSTLVYRDGKGVEQVYRLRPERGAVTIGRRSSNDLAVPWDTEMSRLHARVEYLDGAWTVVDDGLSRNGTQVNGWPVRGRRALSDGDVLRLGKTVMVYRTPRATTQPSTESLGSEIVTRIGNLEHERPGHGPGRS